MYRWLPVFVTLTILVSLAAGAVILQDSTDQSDLQTSETYWGGWGSPWGWGPGYRGGPGGWGGWGVGGWGGPWGYGYEAPWASGSFGFGPFSAGIGLGRWGGW